MNREGLWRCFVSKFVRIERRRLHQASHDTLVPVRRAPVGVHPPAGLDRVLRRSHRRRRGRMRQPENRCPSVLMAGQVDQVLSAVPDGRHERDRRGQRIREHGDESRDARETTEAGEMHEIAVEGRGPGG